MKISRDWLQTYFEKPLPKTEELVRGLTMHAFEIESVENFGDDEILDVKVLPNRAHDCLCHYGIAKEVSTIFEMPIKKKLLAGEVRKLPESNEFSVKIETSKIKRFKAVSIHGVKVAPSPEWLKKRIEVMNGKSINNIVDITNFVMFELGQPMHAFDADKLIKNGDSGFVVRESKNGEKIVTLDGVERTLKEGALLITDAGNEGKTILGIAGIKGGTETEISEKTKNIILEAATFDAPTIRKHAKLLNIRTDASVRFENGLAPELPTFAVDYAIKLIEELAKGENFQVEGEFDYYPRKRNPFKIGASLSEINGILGTSLKENEVEKILQRLDFKYEKINDPKEAILKRGKELVGQPYKLESSVSYDAPEYFDCSSLVTYLFSSVGISVPRISIDQFVFGEEISENNLQIGDLIFSNSGVGKIWRESVEFLKGTKVPSGIDHVGIFAGNGEILHASRKDGCVVVEKIVNNQVASNIVGYRRIIKENEPRFVVSVPFERLDLIAHTEFNISGNKEDLIEEIGRIYGLEHIISRQSKPLAGDPETNKEFYDIQKVRDVLVNKGYSEVYTYSLVDSGEVEIENPVASDKAFMRHNLKDGIKKSLELNSRNMPLLGLTDIKIFEIGTVFGKSDESIHVCTGVFSKGKFEITEYTLEDACKRLDVSLQQGSYLEMGTKGSEDIKYKFISPYPFALRDIAVFVPEGVSGVEVERIVRDSAGGYLVRVDLFDEFKKEGKVSYAYHLVFQSTERTLTEIELNEAMEKITESLNGNSDWQVR